jgi:hypothetical protein
VESRLCPRCGAYWQCDCRFEELTLPEQPGCDHDWAAAVGVEVDPGLRGEAVQVLVCRYCGAYAIEGRA